MRKEGPSHCKIMTKVRHVLGIEARSELCLRSDLIVQVQKIGISRGKNIFHGSIVDFTGLAQKQPISRTRDTVKKEGP